MSHEHAEDKTVAIERFLETAKKYADDLHIDLHDLEDELAHLLSHILKHVVSLNRFLLVEQGKALAEHNLSSESLELLKNNVEKVKHDIGHLISHAQELEDEAMEDASRGIQLLVTFADFYTRSKKGADEVPNRNSRETLQAIQNHLKETLRDARKDVAVRFCHLTIRSILAAWSLFDSRLAELILTPHDMHEHAHEEKYTHGHVHPHE